MTTSLGNPCMKRFEVHPNKCVLPGTLLQAWLAEKYPLYKELQQSRDEEKQGRQHLLQDRWLSPPAAFTVPGWQPGEDSTAGSSYPPGKRMNSGFPRLLSAALIARLSCTELPPGQLAIAFLWEQSCLCTKPSNGGGAGTFCTGCQLALGILYTPRWHLCQEQGSSGPPIPAARGSLKTRNLRSFAARYKHSSLTVQVLFWI